LCKPIGEEELRVTNETERNVGVAFAELLRLQTEFQTRLTEETLNHLRRIQAAAMPVVPATVAMPGGDSELRAIGSPGTTVDLTLELDNRQRVHCVVTPMLSPLVAASGVTWFPSTDARILLLAPDEVVQTKIPVELPDELPPGVYRGALLLHGFHAGAIGVAIDVTAKAGTSKTASAARKASALSTTKKRVRSGSKKRKNK
jgi:hypothetical protein